MNLSTKEFHNVVISILLNGNIFKSYKGHLKGNPIPHNNFLTREFVIGCQVFMVVV